MNMCEREKPLITAEQVSLIASSIISEETMNQLDEEGGLLHIEDVRYMSRDYYVEDEEFQTEVLEYSAEIKDPNSKIKKVEIQLFKKPEQDIPIYPLLHTALYVADGNVFFNLHLTIATDGNTRSNQFGLQHSQEPQIYVWGDSDKESEQPPQDLLNDISQTLSFG